MLGEAADEDESEGDELGEDGDDTDWLCCGVALSPPFILSSFLSCCAISEPICEMKGSGKPEPLLASELLRVSELLLALDEPWLLCPAI